MTIVLGPGKELLLKALRGDLDPREKESAKMRPFCDDILSEQRELDYPFRMIWRSLS